MPATGEQNISSFLIRFIDETQQPKQTEPTYRGLIRHIQSGDELSFTRWSEAADFIQRFFPVEDLEAGSRSKA